MIISRVVKMRFLGFLFSISSAQDCLNTQYSMRDQTIPHQRGLVLATVNIKNRAILEMNVTFGNAQNNKWRNLIHIGNIENHRQPSIYLKPNSMHFTLGFNQDTQNYGQLLIKNMGLKRNSAHTIRIETSGNTVEAYIDGQTAIGLTLDYPEILEVDNQNIMSGSNFLGWSSVDMAYTGIEYSTYEPCPPTTTTEATTTEATTTEAPTTLEATTIEAEVTTTEVGATTQSTTSTGATTAVATASTATQAPGTENPASNQGTIITVSTRFPAAALDLLNFKLGDSQASTVMNHGCWCAKLLKSNTGNIGGPSRVDDLDEICKRWFSSRRCVRLLGGICYNVNNYFFSTYNFDTATGSCEANSNQCTSDICQIDRSFIQEIHDYVNNNNDWSAIQRSSALCLAGNPQNTVKVCSGSVGSGDLFIVPAQMTTLRLHITMATHDCGNSCSTKNELQTIVTGNVYKQLFSDFHEYITTSAESDNGGFVMIFTVTYDLVTTSDALDNFDYLGLANAISPGYDGDITHYTTIPVSGASTRSLCDMTATSAGSMTNMNHGSGAYSNDQNCKYTLKAPYPGWRVRVVWEHFDLEYFGHTLPKIVTTACPDWFKMDGTKLDSEAKYCGTAPPTTTSKTDQMTLEFSSDATIGRSGWKFSWVWVDEHDNPIDDSASSIDQGSSVMRQLSAEADYPASGCRAATSMESMSFLLHPFSDDANGENPQTLQTQNKTIRSSPNYSTSDIMWSGEDRHGLGFKHCTWFIYPRNESSVTKIEFNYFDLYSEGHQCSDVLEINEVKFCGNQDNIEMVQYFTGSPLKVQFRVYGKNDWAGNRHRGFEFDWSECDQKSCSEVYDYAYENSGEIESAEF